MTREEAAKYFKRHIDLYCVTGICREAEEMAIEVLEQEPCEDCISRAEVLGFLKGFEILHSHDELRSNLIYGIMSLPSVTPQPKTGKWIRWYETIEQEHCTIHDPHCKCSECNQEYDPYIASLFNYCPNCGYRMVEPQESEDKE